MPWGHLGSDAAMEHACGFIESCVAAGLVKLHVDSSGACLGDSTGSDGLLPVEIIAERSARLVLAAETAYERTRAGPEPLYVIGSDVPQPGGGLSEDHEGGDVTEPDALDQTLRLTRECFVDKGLERVWNRVIAVVVKTGAEFSPRSVSAYRRDWSAPLTKRLRRYEGFVFEAHSTDFQSPDALREMVADGFLILKVGPALTFAFREAVFALAAIETEWLNPRKAVVISDIVRVLERAMVDDPGFWKRHYRGTEDEQAFLRRYAWSDRCRYYWSLPRVAEALSLLFKNLGRRPIPLTLISQFFPDQISDVRFGDHRRAPEALIRHRIQRVIDGYDRACREASSPSLDPAFPS
jgi:D-tagatose-1,6-bisphosphate aldolase subunit GatZ/KbaZ